MKSNIILIGFMGSGKSSVGKKLAVASEKKFIEMDDVILAKSGKKSINEIFQQDGETYFRELEISTAKELAESKNAVISTGGGVVMNKIILDYLRKDGIVLYLDASFETIQHRLRKDTTRPLFKDKERALQLYNFRKNLYSSYADEIIPTDKNNKQKIIAKIMEVLT